MRDLRQRTKRRRAVVSDRSNGTLQAAWDSQKWPRAAEIIRYSNAGWPDADARPSAMMKTVIQPQLINGSTSNGNWEISMIEGLIGIGVYNDDRRDLQHRRHLLEAADSGVFLLPHRRRRDQFRSARHRKLVWADRLRPFGRRISQETCRDFGHAQYGISGALDAAETAGIQGINLYQNT